LKYKAIHVLTGLLVLASFGLAACSAQLRTQVIVPKAAESIAPAAVEPTAQATFTDPFAYCASVGTIDQPDARYHGPENTDAIVKGYLKAAGIKENSQYSEVYKRMTIWHCMDHQVYACNFGANLPCNSKANTVKTPTQAMADFCKSNPNADFIPMSVTGHDIIYSFHCVQEAPELLEQIAQVDAAGYLANIWYAIEP
jgi:hypothetical protein